jgi:hypothetical protein
MDLEMDTVESGQELPNSTEEIMSTIQLVVGAEKQIFTFDEHLICSRCPFFYNAFSGNFLEAQTKLLNFPDDDPARFGELHAWLHNEGVPSSSETWLGLSETWFFGEKYHIDELQNAVVDALYAKFAAHDTGINIAFDTLDYIAEHTYPRSPLRLLFSDMLANGTSLIQLPERLDNIPQEFVNNMCISYATRTSRNGPSNISLLSSPISTYYSSSAACKATAMPKPVNQGDAPTGIFCEGDYHERKDPLQPIRETLHICTTHNVTLCSECRYDRRGHRKKMMTLISDPYRDAVTGRMTIIDAQVNDSGFYCDGYA